MHNPTGKAVQLGLEKLGIAQWDTAKSFTRWAGISEKYLQYIMSAARKIARSQRCTLDSHGQVVIVH